MFSSFSRWYALGLLAVVPALFGADGKGCGGQVPIGGDPDSGTGAAPGALCKADFDCPITAICKPCPDGRCANPNVHCENGRCTAPNYTCDSSPTRDAGSQC